MSEEQVQEQVGEQVEEQAPKQQNKLLAYFKNRDFLNLVAYLFIVPFALGAAFGLIIAILISIFHDNFGSLSSELPFGEKFISIFHIFFPIGVIIVIVKTIAANFQRKYKQYVFLLILTPLLLVLAWQFGGKQAFEKYKSWMDERIENAITFGNMQAEYQKTEEAVSEYKLAVFLDKYLAFWNDNKNLPVLYYKMARSYGDTEDLDHAIEYIEKSLEAFSEYSPEDIDSISLARMYGCIVFGAKNNYASVKTYASAANEYYKNNYDTVDHRSLAQSYVWLANAYFNEGNYANAAECLEKGIPLYYDTTAWGYGDTSDAKVIAILYKIAAQAYSNIGNQEKSQEYNDKYEDFMWYRDFSESDLDYYINYFHWMNR